MGDTIEDADAGSGKVPDSGRGRDIGLTGIAQLTFQFSAFILVRMAIPGRVRTKTNTRGSYCIIQGSCPHLTAIVTFPQLQSSSLNCYDSLSASR